MNRQESDILLRIAKTQYVTQREVAEDSGHSLGIVNRAVKELQKEGYIDGQMQITDKAREFLRDKSPRNAIILAAGYGMRMVPINREVPKGLLEVKGEVLIERIIGQIQQAGIRKIYVIVGFLKEKYEYLIDKYGVELIANPEYSSKNNLHSLKKAVSYISDTYIVPCDIWCRQNPFSSKELYSWYMVGENTKTGMNVRVNRKKELVMINENELGNEEIGIAYLHGDIADNVKENIDELCRNQAYDNAFWEAALFTDKNLPLPARIVNSSDVVEINTYEQLREFDNNSNHLKTEALQIIADVLHTKIDQIENITILKKGMTNRSFLFTNRDQRYIMRIPGEGTKELINRKNEAEVYRKIDGESICDDVIYINKDNGYKITAYLENARVCDPLDQADVAKCMDKLRDFHNRGITVGHEFCLFEQIKFYEALWEEGSIYGDYEETRDHVLSLSRYIDAHSDKKVLSHIDAVPDNFLLVQDGPEEKVYLIDWEYAGMHDPHIDLAMFGVYAFYTKEQIDELMQIYFCGVCPREIKIKIYCYVAACGMLWSNWCEYKRSRGVDFGEYSLRQYRYAKDFFKIVCEELGGEKVRWGIV